MQIFFNGAAHQLKTPLTSIIGYSQMIQVSEDSDEICEDAFVIEEAGEKLLKSINTLIADSRHGADVGPIQPTKVKFDELAGECLQLLKPRLQKLHIDCEIIGIKGVTTTTDREILKEIIQEQGFLMKILSEEVQYRKMEGLFIFLYMIFQEQEFV